MIATNPSTVIGFPSQRKTSKERTEEWYKDCCRYGAEYTNFGDDSIRATWDNKYQNYRMFNGHMDMSDIEKVFNPFELQKANLPADLQNYPIEIPKFNLLQGEETKRRFDWRLVTINEDAISDKEEMIKQNINQFIISKITSENEGEDEETIKRELSKLDKWRKFEAQDHRERTGTFILNYLWKTLELKDMFTRGFMDPLICAEEIYAIEIINKEPRVRKCDPLNVMSIRNGQSCYIEHADIIKEDAYCSLGELIDDYHDYLTQDDIDSLEQGLSTANGLADTYGQNNMAMYPYMSSVGDLLEVDDSSRYNSSTYDNQGNILKTRVVWKSMRKVGKLKYFDPEVQDYLYTFVPEEYKKIADKEEEIEWFWINQWEEATRIANDIYVKMQPLEFNSYDMDTMELKSSPYVGTYYNVNTSRAVSLYDRIKPSKIQYNIIRRRIELALAKNKGKILEVDFSKIPDGWDPDKWLYYLEVMGIAVVDSFKEGNKGAATGKLAGQFNTTGKVFDLEMGNYIQQHIGMLQLIENEIGRISGVSQQREGQISNDETVGGVERSVMQSSHMTEPWFMVHDNIKRRVLMQLLEAAKHAWKDLKQKKLKYILDDMSEATMTIDMGLFWSTSYGMICSDAGNDMAMLEAIKQLAHAAMQNDKLNFSQVMDIYSSTDLASKRRKIEQGEEELMMRQQQQQEKVIKSNEEIKQMEMQMKQMEMELAKYKIDQDNNTKIEVAILNKESSIITDANKNGIRDSIDQAKLSLKERETNQKNLLEKEKLDESKRAAKRNEELKEKQINKKSSAK